MDLPVFARKILLAVQGAIALTAVLGGAAMTIGALTGTDLFVQGIPLEFLDGSPFESYLVPGILLAVVIGGVHVLAYVMLKRRKRRAVLASAVAGFAMLVWIFVQMIYIPFSFLQAIYFGAGLLEIGLVLLMLGLFTDDEAPATE